MTYTENLHKARLFVSNAKLLYKEAQYDSSISRSYYSVFQACVASFKSIGIHQQRYEHRFLVSHFALEFSRRRKIFPAEFAALIGEIYDERVRADYSADISGKKKAKSVLDKAEKIVYFINKALVHEKKK